MITILYKKENSKRILAFESNSVGELQKVLNDDALEIINVFHGPASLAFKNLEIR